MARTNRAFQEFMAQEYPDFNEKYRQFLQSEMNQAFIDADLKKMARLMEALKAHLGIMKELDTKDNIE